MFTYICQSYAVTSIRGYSSCFDNDFKENDKVSLLLLY